MYYFTILFQVEVEFANGNAFNLSAEFLRIYSPAADGRVRSIGGEKVKAGFSLLLPNFCYLR